MAQHNETGRKGEELAREYLIEKGYEILDTNWICNHREIDIVALKGDLLVFIEVKTRASLEFELPKEAVTLKKQKNLVKAADDYIQEKDIDLDGRFDIISVYAREPMRVLEHIEEAFIPAELF